MTANINLLIMPQVVKDRMSIHSNVDDKLIWPEIKAAQDMFIRPLLGSILFDRILNDITAGSLTGQYLLLMNNFIIDALCNYVMSEMPEALNFQFWNKGLATKTTDNSNAPSMGDMYTIVSKYKKRAEMYAQNCRLYLVTHAPQTIPEYYAPGGIDRVVPDRAVYSCPIYLGGSGDIFMGANHDPNYNSNDPYYIP